MVRGKKRVCALLAGLAVAVLAVAGYRMENGIVYAAEEESTEQTEPESPDGGEDVPGDTQNILELDDGNLYQGMKRTYQNGYEPVVSKNTATVILPLYAEGTELDSVKVTPDLGATEDSPFVYRNYQKTFGKTEESINNGKGKKTVFLVRFDFALQSDRYNGVYPVTFKINYSCKNIPGEQMFTSYVHIKDGKEREEETESVQEPEEEIPSSEPKVVIAKCEGMPEKIESGDTFGVSVVLKNTNKKKYVQNMTVTVSCESPDISLKSDSNVFYYDYLGTEKTLKIPLEFQCSEKTEEGVYAVKFEMAYDNPKATALTTTGQFDVTVSQKLQVELEAVSTVTEVNAGDGFTIPVQALNLGRGSVYNVRCSVDVPGLTAEKSLFLGNMEGGSAASGELSIFVGMVNEAAENEKERYGQTRGNVLLTYEDENGKEYTVQKEIAMKINPLEVKTASQTDNTKEKGIGFQLLAGGGVIVAVILFGTIAAVWFRRKGNGSSYDKI